MVRATFAGLTTAYSALQANQKRLDIVGQNLANMNTVGYTRQQLETSSVNYTNPVSHYMNGSEVQVGFGTKMDRVSQIRDPYLDVQYRDQIVKSSYNDSMQTSLDALSRIFDESNISGIRQAFDDIQSTLTNMQDPAKINNPIYESELKARMQALTNLINDAARRIEREEANEFQRLDGTGTNERGAIQTVNNILEQIGNLNIQIKRNQIHGQPSLELMDERNVLLDELASYVPIDIRYENEKGNSLEAKDWPDDLYVDILYTNEQGVTERLEIIKGTEGGQDKNYGSLAFQKEEDPNNPGQLLNTEVDFKDNPTSVTLSLTEAQGTDADDDIKVINNIKAGPAPENAANGEVKAGTTFASGSIQSSLDMLGQTGTGVPGDKVRGYQYYMNQLNNLAKSFADVINHCNTINTPGRESVVVGVIIPHNLLDYSSGTDANGNPVIDPDKIALNIGLDAKWVDGTNQIAPGNKGGNSNDVILDMLDAMTRTWDGTGTWPSDADTPLDAANVPDLDGNSFADFMNHISTVLANDSQFNTTELETNVTVLNGIQESRDSISAVSLDEEAANMMAYLSAYNAASRLMTTLDQALDTLINNTGVVGR